MVTGVMGDCTRRARGMSHERPTTSAKVHLACASLRSPYPPVVLLQVRRLNIMFDSEEPELWKRRRAAALELREQTKQELRFDHFIAQQSLDEVRQMQQSTLRGVHEKVADGLPADVPFPEVRASRHFAGGRHTHTAHPECSVRRAPFCSREKFDQARNIARMEANATAARAPVSLNSLGRRARLAEICFVR